MCCSSGLCAVGCVLCAVGCVLYTFGHKHVGNTYHMAGFIKENYSG